MKRAFWIILSLLAVSIAINVWQCSRQPQAETRIERDTVWRDSVIREPAPAETIQTDRVVYIKVAVPQPHTRPDTVHDSIEVPVPIVQKRYEDSLYTAWVSGYEPALDSIDLRLPTVTETVTKTIVKPSPLITFGIQAGAGVGIIRRQPDFYIGFGGQINLWRKSLFSPMATYQAIGLFFYGKPMTRFSSINRNY